MVPATPGRNMGRADREANPSAAPIVAIGGDLGCGSLSVGEMLLADLLATVTTIRFQPTSFPGPMPWRPQLFTQVGMNRVE